MSSRVSFAVYDVNGLKTDLTASDFAILKDGVLDGTLVVTPNNDGTYYYEITVSAKYTVKVRGTAQDEMTNIFIPTDDIIVQGDVDGVTLEFASGTLHVKADGIDTTELADGAVTTVKLGADAVDDTKIANDAVKREHLNSNIVSYGMKQDTNGALEVEYDPVDFYIEQNKLTLLNKSFSGVSYIDSANSLHENLVALDIALRNIVVTQGLLNSFLMTFSAVATATYTAYMTKGDYAGEVIMPFAGTIKGLYFRKAGGSNATQTMIVTFSAGDTIGLKIIVNPSDDTYVQVWKNGADTGSGLSQSVTGAATYIASLNVEIS